MMGPAALVLANRTGQRVRGMAGHVLGYLGALLAAGIPVALVHPFLGIQSNVGQAILLGGAAAYQFSRPHNAAIVRCAHDTQVAQGMAAGVRQGTLCLVACGPLMAVMLVGNWMSWPVMAVSTGLMTCQLLGKRSMMWSYLVGTVVAIAAVATLFMGHDGGTSAPTSGTTHHVM